MQHLLDQDTSPKVALPSGRYVDDFTGFRISCGRFRLGILDTKDPESTNLNPVALDQALAHRLEEGIHPRRCELLLDAQLLRNPEREIH